MVPVFALSVCAALSGMVDDIEAMKKSGLTEQQAVQTIEQMQLSEELKLRARTSIPVVYALGQGVSTNSWKVHLLLTCDNPRVIRGNKHTHQGSGRGAGDRSSHEQYRRVCSDEAWDEDPR